MLVETKNYILILYNLSQSKDMLSNILLLVLRICAKLTISAKKGIYLDCMQIRKS